MKSIGDSMEISEVLLGHKSCCVCKTGRYTGDFVHCANCDCSAHTECARKSNWYCNNCRRRQEEEEEEDAEEAEEAAEEEEAEEAPSGETYKYTVALSRYGFQSVRPLGNRVLVKTKSLEDVSSWDSFHTCLEIGMIVDVGEGRSCSSFEVGQEIVFYQDSGTKVILNEQHYYILLGMEDVLGYFELFVPKDVSYVRPVADRVLIQVVEVNNQLAHVTDPFPTMGRVMSVGPDASDIKSPSSVIYSKSTRHEMRSCDGMRYAIVKRSDVVALLSFKELV